MCLLLAALCITKRPSLLRPCSGWMAGWRTHLQIDCQSGVLTAEEGDFKTAFSYFFEGYEQYSSLGEPKAASLLKYMLLCKIMLDEVNGVWCVR
jgi:hypothetical protein